MLERRYLKAMAAILVAFSAGLVLFFIFSAPYGDGLEKTMENGGVEESEPVYHAPLDYGGNYPAALLMGILGFAVVLGSVYLVGKGMGKKRK
jgi:hypothetical protein